VQWGGAWGESKQGSWVGGRAPSTSHFCARTVPVAGCGGLATPMRFTHLGGLERLSLEVWVGNEWVPWRSAAFCTCWRCSTAQAGTASSVSLLSLSLPPRPKRRAARKVMMVLSGSARGGQRPSYTCADMQLSCVHPHPQGGTPELQGGCLEDAWRDIHP